MDLTTLLNLLRTDGDLIRIANDPMAMFGSDMLNKSYLGARFLPEKMMMGLRNNIIKVEETRFRTIIAEDSGKYDAVPLRHLAETFDMTVEMGYFDIGREISGSEYDAILQLLAAARSDAARARMLLFVDSVLNYGLKDKKEKQRWDAIVNRRVRIEKSNGQLYDVLYDFPAGNDFPAPAFFTDNNVDPFDTIFDAIDLLKDLGYGRIEAIVSRSKPLSAMMRNESVKSRFGGMRVNTANNTVTPVNKGIVGKSLLDQTLSQEGYPGFTEYNEGYYTEAGFNHYLPIDSVTVIGSTNNFEEIEVDESVGERMLIPDVLGYYGVGTCQGQTEAGDVIKLFPKEDKPVRIEGQAEGVGFPIIKETRAIVNIRNCVEIP